MKIWQHYVSVNKWQQACRPISPSASWVSASFHESCWAGFYICELKQLLPEILSRKVRFVKRNKKCSRTCTFKASEFSKFLCSFSAAIAVSIYYIVESYVSVKKVCSSINCYPSIICNIYSIELSRKILVFSYSRAFQARVCRNFNQ